MKIEKLNEYQMRFTIMREDMEENDIDISDLTGQKTEKADELLRHMMDIARDEYGFEADDTPLVVEAMQVGNDCMVFIVTKVSDDEDADLDPKYKYIKKLRDNILQNTNLLKDSSTLNELSKKLGLGGTDASSDADSSDSDVATSVNGRSTGIDTSANNKQSKKTVPDYAIYTFDDMEVLISVAKMVDDFYCSSNDLYKSPDGKLYVLIVHHEVNDTLEFKAICDILREFGKPYRTSYGSKAYINEHYTQIIKRDALETLAQL